MSRYNIILAGLLFLVNNSLAAQTVSLEPLRKGDTVPNVSLEILVNNKVQKLHLYDFNKKLILFDFWSINCSSCISQMPHLQELQQKFNQEIQVIIVTKNTRKEVEHLKERLQSHASNEIGDAFNSLPFVAGDSLLSFIFPHDGFPIHVWIDSAKTLKAIAYSNTTTNENVYSFLNGKKIRLAEQGLRNIDRHNPVSWLDADTGYISQLKYYSFIFSRIEHTGGFDGEVFASFDSTTGKLTSFNIVNSPIVDLYKLAYFKYKHPNIGIADNKIFLETKNNNRFYSPKNQSMYFDWADSNLYAYAIKVPPQRADSIYIFMKEELDKFFKLKSRIEYRKVKCMVLKRTKPLEKLRSKYKVSKNELIVDSMGSNLILHNQPIALLTSRIETLIAYDNPFQPFFDETNFDKNIDIVLPWNNELEMVSLAHVRKILKVYGLDLQEEYKTLRMLVLSD